MITEETPEITPNEENVNEPEATHTEPAPDGGNEPDPGDGGDGDLPQYTPNYGYKVMNEQREIPDWARGYVTDEESEKKFRDLFERADGIQSVKEHRDRLKQENSEFKQQAEPAIQHVQNINTYLQNNDLDNFFKYCNINDQTLFKFVQNKLQLLEQAQQNPNAIRDYQGQADVRQQMYQLQQQNQQLTQNYNQTLVAQRDNEINSYLIRPEIQEVAQTYESRVGKPGAFRDLIIERGTYHSMVNKQDISVDQAVQEALQLIGPQQVAQQTTPNQAPGQAGPKVVTKERKPTLPNMRGSGTSPVTKAPRSTADLRKIAKEKYGS